MTLTDDFIDYCLCVLVHSALFYQNNEFSRDNNLRQKGPLPKCIFVGVIVIVVMGGKQRKILLLRLRTKGRLFNKPYQYP